jgi:hypothetical protein
VCSYSPELIAVCSYSPELIWVHPYRPHREDLAVAFDIDTAAADVQATPQQEQQRLSPSALRQRDVGRLAADRAPPGLREVEIPLMVGVGAGAAMTGAGGEPCAR